MRAFRASVALVAAAAVVLTSGCSPSASGGDPGKVTLTLGSWRTEDLAMWQDEILPAFEKTHPTIDVKFSPTNTNEYNAAIQSQVDGGTGPDLITCRPYDVNRSWIKKGYFEKLDGKPMLDAFDPLALDPWAGDDGSPYCLPTAAVLAGFFYNKDIFTELNLQVPTTQDEFLSVLKAIKDNGKYAPLAVGSAESWQLAYNGLYSIGPAYWKGEEGRQGLIKGTKKVTDPDFVAAFSAFDAWKPYLPKGSASLKYSDMTQLFALGKAAILPDGSWDINQVAVGNLNVGVFGPPAATTGGERYVQEMPDMAIGVSAASKHKAEAETFLAWTATPEFLSLYVNKLPGFFSMGKEPVTYTNKLAQEFADLKQGAKLTPRLGLDRLSAGTPPFDDEVWRVLQLMYTKDLSPQDATAELQKGLSAWYAPQQQK
ncbi:sugar ABC transporter substrate-binding protein [Asanoa ishikariensis]|uniref:Probable sugar-binding periplasmic protein n=1 Tax=Asanoa ishikariensis TaxID=137265 RepID=A0A1H3UM38_9ACTN|nr:ABC transporter substrate-binding protein [Asanoa ishikariensis]GIF69927.1 sugar ABC transporter substrate-binding protein [Asanoa ishikariensis]SDZ63493.1 carbohydrate ABC transporter substrate-binding protein, CUT1 family [Asanoa ishikariensis]